MKLKLSYYALLAEQARCHAEEIESQAQSPAVLYAELVARHGFTLPRTAIRPALNDEFCTWETPLKDGDLVVFIPPVNGG